MLNGGGGGMPGFMGMGGGGLLSQMFGGGGRRRARKGKNFILLAFMTSNYLGEATVQPLHVALEDLYKGKTSKLQLTKKALCKSCNGFIIIILY
jgi:DnaJ homolog subfamily A member 2